MGIQECSSCMAEDRWSKPCTTVAWLILPLHGFNNHQLAFAFYMASYAIWSKLHFTTMTAYCIYTPSGKEKNNKVMKVMFRKATKVHVYVQCFSLFSKPERTSWSLTPQLNTVIFEVSSVKELSLRGNIYTEAIQGQTFAINELDLWWHKIVHWLN